MAHITIKDLSFSYPVDPDRLVLDHVSVNIEQGQYVTLCGKSGCGKTTLLNQLKTVLTPNGKRTGEVLLDGVSLDQIDLRTPAASEPEACRRRQAESQLPVVLGCRYQAKSFLL